VTSIRPSAKPATSSNHRFDRPGSATFVVSDNRTSELGGYDDALAYLLSYLDEDDAGTGYTEDNVARLLEPPDMGDDEGKELSAGVGEPVVAYQLVLDDETQQARWYAFVRWLKREFPGTEKLGERLVQFFDARVPGIGGADR
jgi:hypothetical protein